MITHGTAFDPKLRPCTELKFDFKIPKLGISCRSPKAIPVTAL